MWGNETGFRGDSEGHDQNLKFQDSGSQTLGKNTILSPTPRLSDLVDLE